MIDDEPRLEDIESAEAFYGFWSELGGDLATAAAEEKNLIIEWKQARRYTLELFKSAPSDPQGPYEEALQQLQSDASQSFGEATLAYMLREEGLGRQMRDEE